MALRVNFFKIVGNYRGRYHKCNEKIFLWERSTQVYNTYESNVAGQNKEFVRHFSYLRPISLSTFMNKIISRTLHERLTLVLPNIISQNQSSFVKERSIAENILLAQEIIRDINMRSKDVNVVVN